MQPIIDSHCHIYPDKIALRAAQSIGKFYDIPMNLDGRVETLLAEGKQAGITHFLVHSVSTHPSQVRSINEFISAQVAASGGCMSGFGTLHPDSPTIDEDLEHLIELGLKGVKIHPDVQGFALDSEKSIAMCRRLVGRLPVLVHTGDYRYDFSNPPQVARFLDALPELQVIGAHFAGWSVWEEAARTLAGRKNLLVDCSSSLYALTPAKAKELFDRFGPERVLFGSDYPMWRPQEELERLRLVGLTPQEERMVLYDNAARLLGFSL